jgi:hypothetical protein
MQLISMKKILFLAIIIPVTISGCINEVNEKDIVYFCEIDSDCVVKDVHNCCGYYPRCVNKNHEPDIEAVRRECQEKQIDSICGWPEISHCECINNTCRSMQGEMEV